MKRRLKEAVEWPLQHPEVGSFINNNYHNWLVFTFSSLSFRPSLDLGSHLLKESCSLALPAAARP